MVVKNIKLFLERPKFILNLFGIWLPPENSILHKIYMIFIMSTQYCFLVFEFVYIAEVWGDIGEVTEASFLLFTQASVCYKATLFLINKNKLIDLLEDMGNRGFAPQCEQHENIVEDKKASQHRNLDLMLKHHLVICRIPNSLLTNSRCIMFGLIEIVTMNKLLIDSDQGIKMEQKDIRVNWFLLKHSRRINNLCTFFASSALTTCTLWAIIPLFDRTATRFFPFKIWMPVDPQRSPDYELGYVCQVATIYISAFLFVGVDSTTLSMIMFGCAQLDIIMNKLQNIQVAPWLAASGREVRKKCLKSNYRKILECIKHHQAVTRFIDRVEDTYHANIFFQLSGTVGIVCIIGLRISIVEPRSVQFFSMLTYLMTMLSQLFLYCWCGSELTIRSEDLRDQLYQCPWYTQNVQFSRLLSVALERMKRPIVFKAGHYIPLSRPTFVTILRSSYSYFAVLNQTNKK